MFFSENKAFPFRPLLPTGQLTYETLTMDNCYVLLDLFAGDDNPFVDRRFKERSEVESYAQFITESVYSMKRAACDYLFKTRDGQYAGVVHLYEMSRETGATGCSVGFATAAPFRRKGLTLEAFRHLISQVFSSYAIQTVHAQTSHLNIASNYLICKTGFVYHDTRYSGYGSGTFNYFQLRKPQFIQPVRQFRRAAALLDPEPTRYTRFVRIGEDSVALVARYFNNQCIETLQNGLEWREQLDLKTARMVCQTIEQLWENQLAGWWFIELPDEGVAGVLKAEAIGWLHESGKNEVIRAATLSYIFIKPISQALWVDTLQHVNQVFMRTYQLERLFVKQSGCEVKQ